MLCCGAGTDVNALRRICEAEKNIVLSPAGVPAAEWLEKEFGTPWNYCIPDAEKIAAALSIDGRSHSRILVVHQQVLAGAVADVLRTKGLQADAASFFTMRSGLMKPGDTRLREEMDLRSLIEERKYDVLVADKVFAPLLEGLPVRLVPLPHFAVSGKT